MTETQATMAYDEWEAKHMANKSWKPKKDAQPREGTLTAFVVSLPRDMPRAEVVRLAKAKGFTSCSESTVSTSRWAYPKLVGQTKLASTAAQPASPAVAAAELERPRLSTIIESSAKRSSDELRAELRRIIVRLGTDVVEEILAELLVR